MLQKRLDFGSNGYHVPFVPRAARSARKRGPVQKKVTDNQLCAFDLLATIAGKILLEGETSCQSPPTTDLINLQDIVMDGDNRGNRLLVVEHCDRGSTEVASPPLTLELGIRGLGVDLNEKEFQTPSHDASLAPTKIDLNRDGTDSHSVEDPEILDGISPTLVCSDGSVKLTLGNDPYPCKGDNVAVVSRDDDENSSECIQPSTIKAARSPPTRVGDRRIRKPLESKHRRIFSKCRDGDLTDADVRCLYRNRRIGYKRQRSQRIYPFKRRRFYHHTSLSSSHANMSYKSVYSYPDKAFDSKTSGFSSLGVNGSSACVAGQSTTFSSRESHVKLRIKSFRVPELFIEMPETASIGSLKKTVMEAVTALLGGGLRVGVFLQGKKVRDDNRTLVQSGICHNNKAESLGFSLEPNPSPAVTTPVYSEENSLVLPTDILPQPVPQSPIITSIQQGLSTSLLSADHPAANNLSNLVESDYDSAPSPAADVSGEKPAVDSHALVSLPSGTPQALAVVHSNQKSKRHDVGQRRIRRPFSVSEVEALVHAVEKLGTGRWRDVKIRAFENVKHRTYVDLKDKWKTLVHTASIAPQQRRGEPVPQELLDRVLAAHAYWTEQQSKQQLLPKQPPPSETHLVLCEHS